MQGTVARFSGRVAEYQRYRERFDPEVILPRLRAWTGLEPGWRIADVGAGTGMLADVFLTNGNRVVAVEPNPEMRAACALLYAGEPRLEVREGFAEATGLQDGSVDLVAVGRALHWFDLPRALVEFRRILRPGGWVMAAGLGRRSEGDEMNVALDGLLQDFSPDRQTTRATFTVYERLAAAFAEGRFQREEISQEVHLGWPQFRGLTLSLSHAPLEGAAQFPEFERRLRAIFDAAAPEGLMTMATRYWLAAGQFPELRS